MPHLMGYVFRLAVMGLSYALSYRQDCTYHNHTITLPGTRLNGQPLAPRANALPRSYDALPCFVDAQFGNPLN